MDHPKPEVLRLQNEIAATTAECTMVMNEQFLALIAGKEDVEGFNERIARAQERRQRAMEAFLNHIRVHGWS